MGKYIDNKASKKNQKLAKEDWLKRRRVKNSVGLKKEYTDKEIAKSRQQALNDERIQKRILAEREARLADSC